MGMLSVGIKMVLVIRGILLMGVNMGWGLLSLKIVLYIKAIGNKICLMEREY